jgi:hypothetical protein
VKWEEAHNLVDPFHLKMEAQPLPKRRISLKIQDKQTSKEGENSFNNLCAIVRARSS